MPWNLNALTHIAFLHIAAADACQILLRLGVSCGVVLIDDKIKGSRRMGDFMVVVQQVKACR